MQYTFKLFDFSMFWLWTWPWWRLFVACSKFDIYVFNANGRQLISVVFSLILIPFW